MWLSYAMVTPAPDTLPDTASRAVVRILAPAHSSKDHWDSTPPSRRKEIVIEEENGQRTRVLVIEFE